MSLSEIVTPEDHCQFPPWMLDFCEYKKLYSSDVVEYGKLLRIRTRFLAKFTKELNILDARLYLFTTNKLIVYYQK